MRLETIAVDRYGPLSGCEPACADDITIVAGPNESGKTLLLEGLLQLLDPAVVDHMEPGPRVEGLPIGRVVLGDGTDRHILGDGTTLSDVSPIGPRHLYTLFVVRDGDLALPDNSAYYTSLVEHLGDVHTSEIETIRDGLVEAGRLTPTDLGLSDRKPANTKTAKRTTDALAADIEEYVATATAEGITDLARRRRTLLTERRTVVDDLSTQRAAADLAAIDDAAENLATYRTATETIRSAVVDRETLAHLRELESDVGHARERIGEIDDALDRKRTALTRHRKALDARRNRRTELAQRESAVSRVETALGEHRDLTRGLADAGDAGVLDSRLSHRRLTTVAGLVGAGLAGTASALAGAGGAQTGSIVAGFLGLVALLVAVAAWWSHRRLANRVGAADARERELLQIARDAGFEVDAVSEIPVRIRAYRDELEGVQSRVRELDERVTQTADRVAELEADRRAESGERDRLQAELDATCSDASVDSIDAYERRLATLAAAETRRSNADAVLSRELCEPDASDSGAKIERWADALAERRAAVDAGAADPDRYDEAERERLAGRMATLDAELEDVESALADHRAMLDEFERRTDGLSLPPIVEPTPSLQARTIGGLRDLAGELREISVTIEENAERSRKAIGILDEIRDAEERKAATLFSPEGCASETFAHLTDGRYTAVAYDPDAASIDVHRSDGATLSADQLSQGTRDQLYFAARLALAEQVLGGQSGVLLLDDPFLAADRARLRNGFETLRALAADGWQILYFTAKPEVHEAMADEFGCPVHEMEPLER